MGDPNIIDYLRLVIKGRVSGAVHRMNGLHSVHPGVPMHAGLDVLEDLQNGLAVAGQLNLIFLEVGVYGFQGLFKPDTLDLMDVEKV